MVANYYEQIRGLVAGGVDILLPETGFDTLVLKACLFAIDKYFEEHRHAPAGDDLRHDLRRAAARCPRRRSRRSTTRSRTSTALSVGLNCAVGVDQMRPAAREPGRTSRRTPRQLLPQRRHARRLRRLPRATRSTWRPRWASSPATAGSTSSAAAAARRPSGSTPSPEAVEGVAPRRDPRPARVVVLQRQRAAGRPARDQLRHGRRADQHHRLAASSPG